MSINNAKEIEPSAAMDMVETWRNVEVQHFGGVSIYVGAPHDSDVREFVIAPPFGSYVHVKPFAFRE